MGSQVEPVVVFAASLHHPPPPPLPRSALTGGGAGMVHLRRLGADGRGDAFAFPLRGSPAST